MPFDSNYFSKIISEDSNGWIGSKVIVLGNGKKDIDIGILIDWAIVSSNGQEAPHIRLQNGNEVITMGLILPYSDELYNFIMSIEDDKGAWHLFASISMMLQVRWRHMWRK